MVYGYLGDAEPMLEWWEKARVEPSLAAKRAAVVQRGDRL